MARQPERVGRELSDADDAGHQAGRVRPQLTTSSVSENSASRTPKSSIRPGNYGNPPGGRWKSLKYRVRGLAGLAAAFERTQGWKDAAAAGALLASQAERLVSSDVVWDDLFKAPSIVVLKEDPKLSGIEVPDSNFVQTPDLGSTRTMVPIWERINGSAASGSGATPGGLHGTNIEQVRALPGGPTLSQTTDNIIEAGTDLQFGVTVANGGDSQEVKIEVTLTIQQSPTPIVKKRTIDIIDPDETKTVVFDDFTSVDFSERRIMRIDVDPVPGEAKTDNNSAEYPVIFSLPA